MLFPRSPHLGGPTAGVNALFLTVVSRAFLRNSRQESMGSGPMAGGKEASRGLEGRSGKSQQNSAPTTWGPQLWVVKPHRGCHLGFLGSRFCLCWERKTGLRHQRQIG